MRISTESILDKPVGDIIPLPENGVIDTHCHGRDWGESDKTTIEQVLYEASQSFIGTTFFMPNTIPPLDNYHAAVDYICLIEKARRKLGLRRKQYVFFAATNNNHDHAEEALELEEIVGEKFYPKKEDGKIVTTGKVGISDDLSKRRHLYIVRKKKKIVDFHCDDPRTIEVYGGNVIKAEAEGVKEAIELAEDVPGVKITICHPSCIQSMSLIKTALAYNVPVYTEQVIHYHFFDDKRTNWNPALDPIIYHCLNKPRGPEHRIALNQSLLEADELTGIASDSACHTKRQKLENGLAGIPSNQQLVPATITLAKSLGLSSRQVLNLLYYNPARYYRIPADDKLVLWRLEEREDDAVYNNGVVVNPWKGMKFFYPVERIK